MNITALNQAKKSLILNFPRAWASDGVEVQQIEKKLKTMQSILSDMLFVLFLLCSYYFCSSCFCFVPSLGCGLVHDLVCVVFDIHIFCSCSLSSSCSSSCSSFSCICCSCCFCLSCACVSCYCVFCSCFSCSSYSGSFLVLHTLIVVLFFLLFVFLTS